MSRAMFLFEFIVLPHSADVPWGLFLQSFFYFDPTKDN